MKNISLIISIVLLIAVVYLFIDKFTGGKETVVEVSNNDAVESANSSTIAYIKVDSLLIGYDLYIELEEKLKKRKASLEAQLTSKAAVLEKEFADFQKKEQTGAFLSQESYQSQAETLMKKRENLMISEQDLTQQLYDEGLAMEQQIFDSIVNFIKEFNKDKKYAYVINGGNLLYGEEALNITDTILTSLNTRYNEQTTSAEEE